MATTIHDDLFAPDVIADPYGYFGRLRAEDPVHWNAKYEVWVLTRYDDIVWLIRHPELFSSELFSRDPRPPYPPRPHRFSTRISRCLASSGNSSRTSSSSTIGRHTPRCGW